MTRDRLRVRVVVLSIARKTRSSIVTDVLTLIPPIILPLPSPPIFGTCEQAICGTWWAGAVYFSRIHTIDSGGGGSGRGVPGAGGGPGDGCRAGGWRLYRMGFGIAVIGAPLANVPLMTLTPPS